jgi:PAS domain S-box-containing protein
MTPGLETLEKVIADKAALLDVISEHSGDVLWIMDLGMKTRWVSASVRHQVGYGPVEFLALDVSQRVTPEALDLASAAVEKLKANFRAGLRDRKSLTVELEADHRAKDGTVLRGEIVASLLLDGEGAPYGILGLTRNVHERHVRHERAALDRAIATVSDLAAGLAHRFGNVIAGVVGILSLVKLDASMPAASASLVEEAISSLLGASELTNVLVALGAGVRSRVVGRVDDFLAQIARKVMHDDARLSVEIAPDVPEVEADLSQLAEGFSQLVADARDAKDGGPVRVHIGSTREVPVAGARPAPLWFIARVDDEGPGIPEDLRTRVFSPYFSTKKGAEGLGLTIAYSIFASHGGGIVIGDSPSGGARVTAYLPAARRGESGG